MRLTSVAIHGIKIEAWPEIVAWPESLDGWEHLGSCNGSVEDVPRVRSCFHDLAILTLTTAGVPVGRRQVAFRELPSSPGMYWVECACRDSRE
jgi:hypothetical protein